MTHPGFEPLGRVNRSLKQIVPATPDNGGLSPQNNLKKTNKQYCNVAILRHKEIV